MRKLLLLLVFAMLAVTGAASAATATVTITKAGYVPASSAIAQGDSIQFVNSDTVAHQVVFKSTTGVTCTPNPLVLQAGQSGTCTFQVAGNYSYSDPSSKGKAYKGTVTVKAAAESLTLAAAPHVLNFGATTTLSGVLSTHRTGENIDVWATQCGSNAAKLLTVQTTTNGAYSAVVKPLTNTSYLVKVRNTSSAATAVSVRPRLSLVRLGAHRFSLKASAAVNLAGKYASFQRYNGTRWIAVKTVRLRSNTSGVSPAIVAAASFRSTVRAGLRVRATLGQAQVGTCYLPGISNTVRS
jgi:plastocyanin